MTDDNNDEVAKAIAEMIRKAKREKECLDVDMDRRRCLSGISYRKQDACNILILAQDRILQFENLASCIRHFI